MPFETLREDMLRAGIAPRRVRRYLRELENHLSDLTEQEIVNDHDYAEAALRARALLGSDKELADAWLREPELRSLTARAPWLVFVAMPPLALILGYVLWVLMVFLIGVAGGAIHPHQKIHLPVPDWFGWTGSSLMFAANFLIGPALAWMLVRMARLQRMALAWPLMAVGIILSLGLRGGMEASNKSLQFSLSTILPVSFLHLRVAGRGPVSIHWPILLAQALLLCLPLAWLVWTRYKPCTPA